MVSAILVFGDVQDVMPLQSDTPEGWIKNLVEWNDGQHLANWYLSETGERFEGAGWDRFVHWGNPDHPYEYQNSRYVLYLGGPWTWSEEAQQGAREIVERHAELYGSDRVAVHLDLDHSSIRGRESKLRQWVQQGSPAVPKGV